MLNAINNSVKTMPKINDKGISNNIRLKLLLFIEIIKYFNIICLEIFVYKT